MFSMKNQIIGEVSEGLIILFPKRLPILNKKNKVIGTAENFTIKEDRNIYADMKIFAEENFSTSNVSVASNLIREGVAEATYITFL